MYYYKIEIYKNKNFILFKRKGVITYQIFVSF